MRSKSPSPRLPRRTAPAFVLLAVTLCVSGCASPLAGDWQIGPFTKAVDANPCLEPTPESTFSCPLNGPVRWEELAVYNPAAVVREGKLYLLYRAQDKGGTSRVGLAWSDDGLHFARRPAPVLHPDHDATKAFEAKGGCEDPRVVEDGQGNYVMTYTAYDGKTARMAIATSPDLIHWRKRGLAFAGKYRDEWTKAGAIVSRQIGHRTVAERIDGKYWMYLRDSKLLAATSEDLVQWTIVEDAQGRPRELLLPRPGKFDSELVEPGPPPLLRDDGILIVYNGVNAKAGGDPAIPPGTFCGGQALMDRHDPMRLLRRCKSSFIRPDQPYEMTGQVANVCFLESLARFRGKWFLYYGTADSRIAVAWCPAEIARGGSR
jgi:predicted GH43/DUF377 family glycosyl hydrolase